MTIYLCFKLKLMVKIVDINVYLKLLLYSIDILLYKFLINLTFAFICMLTGPTSHLTFINSPF